MKVLIFMTQFYLLSGAERLALELAVELNKRGIHADILSMYNEDLPGVAEEKEAMLNKGIPFVHFLGMHIHPPIASLLPSIVKLRCLMRKHQYDIVETSMVSPTVLASWATLGIQTRHVVGLHRVFRKDRENTKQHIFLRFSVRCNRRIRYYAISDYVAKHWLRYSRTFPQHTRRVYNAISDDCFMVTPDKLEVHRELGIPEGDRIGIYVGRLTAFKGIDTILEALGPVLKKNNLFLLYVGLPDLNVKKTKEMLLQMEQRIADNNWGNRVKFLGYRKDVPRLMASSDVLIHPTQIEGFGLVLAEAMAAGLPIVASNVEGIPEVLAGTGFFMVPPVAPDVLRDAVFKTLNCSKVEVAQLIEKGRKRAEAFRVEKRTDEMVSLLKDVLDGKF